MSTYKATQRAELNKNLKLCNKPYSKASMEMQRYLCWDAQLSASVLAVRKVNIHQWTLDMKSSWGWWECHSACSSIKCCTRPWLDNGCCRKSQKFAKVITIHPMSDLDDETKIQHSQADISVWMISTSQRNSMVHHFCQYLGKTTFWLLTFFFLLEGLRKFTPAVPQSDKSSWLYK